MRSKGPGAGPRELTSLSCAVTLGTSLMSPNLSFSLWDLEQIIASSCRHREDDVRFCP